MNSKKGLELLQFIEKHVVANPHIQDTYGLAAKWLHYHCPPYIQKDLPIADDYDWMEIGRVMVKHNYTTLQSLSGFIHQQYPKALTADPLDCCMEGCNTTKSNVAWPACEKHMCPLCATIVEEDPHWYKTRWILKEKSMGLPMRVHLRTRDVGRQSVIRKEMDRIARMRLNDKAVFHLCPGVLRDCKVNHVNGYLHSGRCERMCLPTLLDDGASTFLAPPEYDLCTDCVSVNTCSKWRASYSTPHHIFDVDDPDRCKAQICARKDCTRSCACVNCGLKWFESVEKEKTLLCTHCAAIALACYKCHRVAKKGDLFFAAHLLQTKTPPKKVPDPKYCIFCLPLAGERKKGHLPKIKALVLQWRFSRHRETAWLDEQMRTQPLVWVHKFFEPLMNARERWLMNNLEGAWDLLLANPQQWDSTYFLMYRLVQLPRDLFIKIFLLIQ